MLPCPYVRCYHVLVPESHLPSNDLPVLQCGMGDRHIHRDDVWRIWRECKSESFWYRGKDKAWRLSDTVLSLTTLTSCHRSSPSSPFGFCRFTQEAGVHKPSTSPTQQNGLSQFRFLKVLTTLARLTDLLMVCL